MGLADMAKLHKMQTRAKVLTFDIERRPQIGMYWDAKTHYIGRDRQLIRASTITWAAKWYGKREVMYASVGEGDHMFTKPEDTPGYYEMILGMRDLLDEADIVVGYNSVRFDEKKIRGECVRLGIPDPSPFRSLDIFRTTKQMGWDYASLAETLSAFGLGTKTAHQGFGLWVDFMHGDPKARALMEKYNKMDVIQTERAMDALRPYIKDHPNLNLWAGTDADGRPNEVCHACGSDKLRTVAGKGAFTALTEYALVECKACHNTMRRNFIRARTTLRAVR